MRQIQLPADAAQYARFQLRLNAEHLALRAAEARRRAARNVVARPAESYLAEALDRARHALEEAHRGINPNQTQDGHPCTPPESAPRRVRSTQTE